MVARHRNTSLLLLVTGAEFHRHCWGSVMLFSRLGPGALLERARELL